MRIGIDLGGTKIEGRAFAADGAEVQRLRVETPREDYEATVDRIAEVVERLRASGRDDDATVGVGIPGSIVRSTGLVKNANSTWLNGRPLQRDLSARLKQEVRCANDANCLAVSESVDGAGAGRRIVFGVILGTGCGGGVAIDGAVHEGTNGLAGEWGHSPLPLQTAEEWPGPQCYCGRRGCMETWVSGPALEREYLHAAGKTLRGADIVAAGEAGDASADAVLRQWEDRVARGLAGVIHVLDPDVLVMGGGLSKMERLYRNVPGLISRYTFGGPSVTPVVPALHGDASGVRGAAWLWPAR